MKVISKDLLAFYLASNISKQSIAKLLNLSAPTLRKYIKIHNLENYYSFIRSRDSDRVNCEVTFFDNIDTEYKAYIFGFLIADGWITSDGKQVGFCVTESDLDILNKIKIVMKSKSLIYKSVDKGFVSRPTMTLTIGSTYLVKSLTKLGITPNKSFEACLPNIHRDLVRHVLRGMFDGDGSFSQNRPCITTSSLQLTEDLGSLILREYNLELKIYKQVLSSNKFTYKIYFNKASFPVICDMYNNPNIVLDRKMLEFKNYYNYRIKNQ